MHHIIRNLQKLRALTGSVLRKWISNNYFSNSHWAGTSKMGYTDDDRTVVDPLLKVKGVHNLRVADASIIPTIPNGNVHTTVVFIAVMCVNLLLKSNKTTKLIFNEKLKIL